MGFEVSPEPIGRGRSVAPRIVAVILVASSVVGFGLITSRAQQATPDPVAIASVSTSVEPAMATSTVATSTEAASTEPGTRTGPSGPGTVICNDTGALRCGLIVAATMKRLRAESQRVQEIGVWPSLLCHDASDCPSNRFVGYRPLGSAFVSFGSGGPNAWLNVVEPTPDPGRDPLATGPIAWVIRWTP